VTVSIRLMNAVSWRDVLCVQWDFIPILLHRGSGHSTFTMIQFHIFIPHERPRPGGHISTYIFSYTSSPAPSFGKSAACISSSYHFKLSQALLQAFANRTARSRKSDVVTVRLVGIIPTILHILNVIYPFTRPVWCWVEH